MRVVYVAGWQRSGTTLLGDLLGAHPRSLHAGEVSGIWDAADRGGSCSCGSSLPRCPVWGSALRLVAKEHGIKADAWRTLADLTARELRSRRVVSLLRSRSRPDARPADLDRVVIATGVLLRAALATAGAEVLIDSSKLVPGLLAHTLTPRNRVSCVQILRDPRAVAASEVRTRHLAPGNNEFLPPGSSVARSLLRWYGANGSVFGVARAARIPWTSVAYEALAADPAVVVASVTRRLGLDWDPSVISGSTVTSQEHHVAVGNPARLVKGPRNVRIDESWRTTLTGLDRLLAEAVSLPITLTRKAGR